MINKLTNLHESLRQYLLITANYWAFTLTDGALRMLVVLYFHQLGYSPLQIAMLFLFYEFFGVITNLFGGWLGARLGLNYTMNIGLGLQIIALGMLLVPDHWLSVVWVMLAQALSGIAKDLNKMSAKSAIKLLVPADAQDHHRQHKLYRWVAVLTGSKNALKGAGFFLGALLLTLWGFSTAIAGLLSGLILVFLLSLALLKKDLGKTKYKPRFHHLFSNNTNINILSAARLCLFSARDVWFVVALPVYLASQFQWDHWQVGALLASWIMFYGLIQSITPVLTSQRRQSPPDASTALIWAIFLMSIPALIALALHFDIQAKAGLLSGLFVFASVFAVNSSLHSYLIIRYARDDGVSLDVGFYYMANAMGRLLGTVLSGWVFQSAGLEACLWVSSVLLCTTVLISVFLVKHDRVAQGEI